jgi:hypothetical protein
MRKLAVSGTGITTTGEEGRTGEDELHRLRVAQVILERGVCIDRERRRAER